MMDEAGENSPPALHVCSVLCSPAPAPFIYDGLSSDKTVMCASPLGVPHFRPKAARRVVDKLAQGETTQTVSVSDLKITVCIPENLCHFIRIYSLLFLVQQKSVQFQMVSKHVF